MALSVEDEALFELLTGEKFRPLELVPSRAAILDPPTSPEPILEAKRKRKKCWCCRNIRLSAARGLCWPCYRLVRIEEIKCQHK